MVRDRGLVSFIVYGYLIFPALFIEETVLSLMYALDAFVENELAVNALIYFWVLYFVIGLYVCFDVSTMLFWSL